MDAFLVSLGVVAIAEIGDKTQLLAIMLAARYRVVLPIVLGILVATLANHALAAALGGLAADWLGPGWTRWMLGLGFLAMAAWVLVPDKMDDRPIGASRASIFMTTLVAFFLVEIGDKTQIATVALAARFDDIVLVTLGTTAGMMVANVPAVFFGDVAATKIPLKLVRGIAAAVFALLGLAVLFDIGNLLG
ncbi:MAG: putative Ca2+/H+ antiporter (TMEM165/GDT1 family) [Alphaproteobacteria bacterium]|jgi:putative Ca2+/H+ antiporter (TMEM165/GDT1 family)